MGCPFSVSIGTRRVTPTTGTRPCPNYQRGSALRRRRRVGSDRPFPAALVPVGGVRAGPLTTERRLVLAAVNRDLAQVQANDPVVAGEGFVAKRCEDSGCGPF